MRWATRFRERLVLGQVRRGLEDDERVLAWSHARVPGVRAPGVLLVTERRCLVHVASRDVEDRTSPWVGLDGWRIERPARARARLTLVSGSRESVSELSLSSRVRARSASRLLQAISQCTDVPCDGMLSPLRRPPELQAAPRRVRDHARRVAITVLGVAVLLLSVVFASPFVPGPGALTALAGIAILASEYEWARDLHVWASRQLERFLTWLRARRAAFRARRHPPGVGGDGADEPVREAA